MSTRPLTQKQQRFVEEYLIDLNATQAAIRAGYSSRTASQIGERLLRNVEVAREIQRKMDKRSEEVERTARDVVRDIERLTKDAWSAGDLRTALRGLELEGKHRGAFTEQVSMQIDDVSSLSPEERARRLASLAELARRRGSTPPCRT